MGEYVLIKNGTVENIIVADESFVELVKSQYDAIIDHDAIPQLAHIGGQAVQIDGEWVFGDTPRDIPAVPVSMPTDFIDAEVVEPTLAIEAPVTEGA